MITIGKYPEGLSVDEINAYFAHANEMHPGARGTVDIKIDGDFAELEYNISEPCAVPFQRIRRITGYLVGGLGRWNNAKLHELADREKHMGV